MIGDCEEPSLRDGSPLEALVHAVSCWDFNEECAMILSVCHALLADFGISIAPLLLRWWCESHCFGHEALP